MCNMKNSAILNVCLIVFLTVCISKPACATEPEDLSSDYLCEYGIKLYQKGDINGAIHELKKSLMINPANSVARNYLGKIISQGQCIYPSEMKGCPRPSSTGLAVTCAGREVPFQAAIERTTASCYTNYIWSFGDGVVREGGLEISHTYKHGGEYLVTVIAYDSYSSITKTFALRVNTPPVAKAGPNLVCCAGMEFTFDGSGSYDADCDRLSYAWDFGDGKTAKGVLVTHAYARGGEYAVTLKVDDNLGTPCSVAADSFVAKMNEKPTAVIKVN